MSLNEAMGSEDLKKQDRILDSSKASELGNKAVGRLVAGKFNSQQQNEGWENLPPYKQLKVLLAEDDDSTRHVVGALLRNCGYHVVSAPNGLQAWAFLEDHNFDLVLTDVVMPGLSGIGLLSRIVHHESYKRIPVVMMSSHDSTDLVFKCLSKGAADFLVKPVRKNELKNLWQHSWRKCQSISGSGSGCETERFNRRRKGLNDEISSAPGSSDDGSLPDHSDNGSATQSSCTKKVAGLESPRRLKPLRRTRRPIGRDPEPMEGLDVVGPSVRNTEEETGASPDNNGNNQASAMDQAVDLLGNIANEQNQRSRLNEEAGSERGGSNSLEAKDGNSSDPNSASRLELSLRSSCADQPAADGLSERNMLRHSGASAFSRYNTLGGTSRQQQPSLGKDVDFNSGRPGCHLEPHRNADGAVVRQAQDGSCPADKDGAPLSHRPDHIQMMAHPGMPVQYAALLSYDHGMPAYFYAQPALAPWQHAFSPQGPREEAQGEGHHHHQFPQQQYQQQQYTHHYHHHIEHHHHHHHKEDVEGKKKNETRIVKDEPPLGAEAAVCGSTNAADGGNGNNINNGLSGSSHGYGNGNGSMSGSNNGSNGFNNNNNKNNITLAGDSGSGNLISSCLSIPPNSDNGVVAGPPEQSRVARREAALNKFRQKRKERCFEKKVRYHSRKRLAEQRPRVRGQFVSQSVHDSSKLDFQQY